MPRATRYRYKNADGDVSEPIYGSEQDEGEVCSGGEMQRVLDA